MTEADSEKPRNEKVSHLGDISFFRRGPTICVNNQLLPVELMDREAIAESLRSLADMVSSAPNAHSQLTKAGVDCWTNLQHGRRARRRMCNTYYTLRRPRLKQHAAKCVIRIALSENRDKNSTPPKV